LAIGEAATGTSLAELAGQVPAESGAGVSPAFGGKAAGLTRLIALGCDVPAGFVFPATTDLPERWPDALRRDFEQACATLLRDGPIAVRSSAQGEDSAERSFAGLFETTLGVTDLDGAWAAAARCVASGSAERVLAYSGRPDPVPVGIVVQAMVAARVAGVLFTIDPTGSSPGLLVEAVAGTGDLLVGGRVAPSRWRAYQAGTGAIEVHGDAGNSLLDDPTVADLVAKGRDIAGKWGADLDLEWAIDDAERLWWLQGRPITARAAWEAPRIDRTVPDADEGPITVWSNWNVRETLPDPFVPLTWSIWRHSILPAITRDLLGLPDGSPAIDAAIPLDRVNGRIYFNMNALQGNPQARGKRLARLLAFIDRRAAATMEHLMDKIVVAPRKLRISAGERLLGMLQTVASGPRKAWMLLNPRAALRKLADAAARTSAGPPVAALSDADLLAALDLMAAPEAGPLRDALPLANAAFFIWLAADKLFEPWPDARRLLATGVAGNPTTDISLGIDDLVEAARPHGDVFQLDMAWQAELARFLTRYGQRAPREFDLLEPRWADDPAMVVDLVRAELATPGRIPVRDRISRLRAERERRIAEAMAAAPPLTRLAMRRLADAVHAYMPLREAPKHEAMRAMLRIRQAAVELGRRLAERKVIDRPLDVFFLEKDELAGPLDPAALRAKVAARRADYERDKARPAPFFVRSDFVPVAEEQPAAAEAAEPGVLRGVGIGTGRGEGPVVVLETPDPARLPQGAVLVVEFADPGWTPLFPRASALVMEVGGAMCHAAVIARELGIPAVFGVAGARSALKDGDRVVVDGDAGTVRQSAGSNE
jgi:pyruvate,water dikinase